jgi:hypothetical protein
LPSSAYLISENGAGCGGCGTRGNGMVKIIFRAEKLLRKKTSIS